MGKKVWSYEFPSGKIIYLLRPCTTCKGKHFDFECTAKSTQYSSPANQAKVNFHDSSSIENTNKFTGWDEKDINSWVPDYDDSDSDCNGRRSGRREL